jgi:uncharacterized RDD family membrane protein YckC
LNNAATGESSQPEGAGQPPVGTTDQGVASASSAFESEVKLPEWRQELSRRLQEIKSKREAIEPNPPAAEVVVRPATEEQPLIEKREPLLFRPAKPRKPRRAAQVANREVPPGEPVTAVTPEADAVIPPKAPQVGASRWRDIQELIDNTTARLARHKHPTTTPEPENETAMSSANEHEGDKLILLSRTLAGLVDIIIVVVCASSFILAADVLDGIEVFDAVSMIYFVVLLLAVYFVYTFFFLGTANQTIGMMLTDLRIVGMSAERPRATQILIRSITFLLGSAGLGIGLLWSCFNRQSRCLHDQLSKTQVVRVPVY